MLISILKRFPIFQNFAAWLCSLIPPEVEHNLQKYTALRKAFFITGLDGVEGDYLEFGVFTGSSLIFSTRVCRRLKLAAKVSPRFFGFDSFSGFGKVSSADEHPFYNDADATFKVNFESVRRNILRKTRGSEVNLVKGFFAETLKEKSATERGIKKARVVLIDCDLRVATLDALSFIQPVMQPGMILILDDFYGFRGSETSGVAGAFNIFQEANPHLKFRPVFSYGYGGMAFVLASDTEKSGSRPMARDNMSAQA